MHTADLSDAEILRDDRIYGATSLALSGVATWEVVVTFGFDWSIITKKKKWRWLMVLYFLCRICLVLQAWTLAVIKNDIAKINCFALSWVILLAQSFGMCASSLILVLRAYGVWGRDRTIGGILFALSIGQIGLWGFLDSYWTDYWNPSYTLCVPTSQPSKPFIYIATFSYTMGFDLIILALMLKKLFRHTKGDGFRTLLLRDGIYYFMVSILACLLVIVFEILNLNLVVAYIPMSICLCGTTIAATRLFRHPSEFDPLSQKPTSSVVSPVEFWSGRSTNGDVSQTFALADMRTMGHSLGTGPEIRGNTQIDVERYAELEYEKNLPRSIQHVLGQQCDCDGHPHKAPPL